MKQLVKGINYYELLRRLDRYDGVPEPAEVRSYSAALVMNGEQTGIECSTEWTPDCLVKVIIKAEDTINAECGKYNLVVFDDKNNEVYFKKNYARLVDRGVTRINN